MNPISKAVSTFVFAVVFLPSPARGNDQDEEARIQFEQGKEFFNGGKYEQAAIALERAYELRPGYKILYYLGMAESENGNFTRALEAYKRYLAEGGDQDDPSKVEEVKGEIEKLNTRVGMVRITCAIEGAKVKVDSETRGQTPLAEPLYVDVGEHEILVKKGPRELLREVVRVAGGQEIALKVEAPQPEQEAPAPPPADVSAETVEPGTSAAEPPKKKRVWTWVAVGLGAATAIGAVITGVMALQLDDEMWSQCDDDGDCYSDTYDGDFDADSDRLKALGITTDVLIGVAAVSAAVGTVLFFVEPMAGSREKVSFVPSFTPRGAGLGVSGRF